MCWSFPIWTTATHSHCSPCLCHETYAAHKECCCCSPDLQPPQAQPCHSPCHLPQMVSSISLDQHQNLKWLLCYIFKLYTTVPHCSTTPGHLASPLAPACLHFSVTSLVQSDPPVVEFPSHDNHHTRHNYTSKFYNPWPQTICLVVFNFSYNTNSTILICFIA